MSAALNTSGLTAGPPPPALRTLPHLVDWTERTPYREPAHSVQFYADDSVLIEGLTRYVGTALSAGDSAIVIATPQHRDALTAALAARGLDLDLAASQGRYVALDASETLRTFMRRGRPDRKRFVSVVGGLVDRLTVAAVGESPQVAAYGEMVALLWAEGHTEAALQLEHLWNELAETRSFNLHCAYPMSLFPNAGDDALITAVCASHALVIPVESYAGQQDERDRLRAVALLQQKARALETEVAERRRCEAELTAALQLRDQFLGAIAHDLKTPLAGIKGGVQLLQRRVTRGTVTPEQLSSQLSSLDTSATRLTRMVEQLLDIARIQSGRPPELDLRPTDLVDLAERIAAEHQRATERHTIRVESSEPSILGQWDTTRLERVLDNLIDNARKYSPDGGEVVVAVAQPTPETALLTVRDQGIGIPPADLERIFQEFHRVADVSARISGTGIGLASAHQIVTLHGGQIDVQSEHGRGSTFTVHLPITPSPPAAV